MMCDVCNEHNAYGLEEELEDEAIRCHQCARSIYPYDEKVHVYTTRRKSVCVMLCEECHGLHQNSND